MDENIYIFSLNLIEHNIFKRDGCDIIYEKDITLCEALCNVEFPLQLLNGQNIIIKTPDNMVIKPYTIHVLHGLGLPVLGKKQFGDLKIIFNIVFPNRISSDRKPYLYKILTKTGVPNKNINENSVNLILLDNKNILDNKPINTNSDDIEIGNDDTLQKQCVQQ